MTHHNFDTLELKKNEQVALQHVTQGCEILFYFVENFFPGLVLLDDPA